MGTARAPWPAGPPFRSHVIVAFEVALTGSRPALTVLLPGLLALLRRHLTPALLLSLEALSLLGRHGLVLARALEDLLLLLRRQPLEALVRGLELALALLGQRLPALEVLHDAPALLWRHAAKPLEVLARGQPLLG